MKLFNNKSKSEREIEKAKEELISVDISGQEVTLKDIEGIKNFYEKMHNAKINRFNHLLNLCLISSITSSDISILNHKIALTKQKLEKLFFARMLAMIIIEYLNDMNDLLGFKLVKEIASNGYLEFLPKLKELNSQYAKIRKTHGKLLSLIRNNIAAHKTKNALSLAKHIDNLNPDEILEMGIEIAQLNIEFTKETTKIINRIIEEALEKEKDSQIELI